MTRASVYVVVAVVGFTVSFLCWPAALGLAVLAALIYRADVIGNLEVYGIAAFRLPWFGRWCGPGVQVMDTAQRRPVYSWRTARVVWRRGRYWIRFLPPARTAPAEAALGRRP